MENFWFWFTIEHILGIIAGILMSIYEDKQLFVRDVFWYTISGFVILPLAIFALLYKLIKPIKKFLDKRIY